MIIKKEKFKKNNIWFIRDIFSNSNIVIYPDPEFQPVSSEPEKPPLPCLCNQDEKLDFIINELHLKDRFQQ